MAVSKLRPNTPTATTKAPIAGRALRRKIRRTYVYKMTIDDCVAPCAPSAVGNTPAILRLAICKPAIRRTAMPGDRIMGITSKTIAKSQQYPLHSIIYAAVVEDVITSREYFTDAYKHRLDCTYSYDDSVGEFARLKTTNIHANPKDKKADLGDSPSFKNGCVLLCRDFRYFGSNAVRIPDSAPHLRRVPESLGQGHRVFTAENETGQELEDLRVKLWERETSHTLKLLSAVGDVAQGKTKT